MRGSVEVHRYLVERSIPHEFYRLERPLRRIDEASAVLGLQPEIVVSAELFDSPAGPILALTPASRCASAPAVARAADTIRARPMSAARTAAATGYFADWVPPVGHERPARIVIDSSLLDSDVLYASGGDTGVMLVIRSADLMRATAAVVAPLCEPEEAVDLEAPAERLEAPAAS